MIDDGIAFVLLVSIFSTVIGVGWLVCVIVHGIWSDHSFSAVLRTISVTIKEALK